MVVHRHKGFKQLVLLGAQGSAAIVQRAQFILQFVQRAFPARDDEPAEAKACATYCKPVAATAPVNTKAAITREATPRRGIKNGPMTPTVARIAVIQTIRCPIACRPRTSRDWAGSSG